MSVILWLFFVLLNGKLNVEIALLGAAVWALRRRRKGAAVWRFGGWRAGR